jgi:1-acyl-sn-glycerol-3-phosphate acyltransferase
MIKDLLMEQEIRYYSDEVNDDFANTDIKTVHLTKSFKYYSNNFFMRLRKLFNYRCIVTPVTYIYNKLIKRISYKNKQCMKGYKKQAAFIYGNHTTYVCDAFNPTIVAYPRWADVVVNEDTTSIKGIRWLVMDLGALPIPADIHLMTKFNDAIEHAISKRHWVAIYPEAHIWPYYTSVRNFPAVSFRYPVKSDVPVFAYTTTYQKRKHSKKPKMVVYVDGPFFPDKSLPIKQAAAKLRDEVYTAMKKRTDEYSTYEYKYKYVYQQKQED